MLIDFQWPLNHRLVMVRRHPIGLKFTHVYCSSDKCSMPAFDQTFWNILWECDNNFFYQRSYELLLMLRARANYRGRKKYFLGM